MVAPLLTTIAGPIIKGVFGIIDQTVEDKDAAAQIKAKLAEQQHDLMRTHLKDTIDIILAETNGNWLQRSWRPILMLTIVAIIANNYLLVPWLSLFTDRVVVLELPDLLFNLMTVGLGLTVAGRSVEKGISKWKR